MVAANALPAMYEDLANHFARQGHSTQRDQCLLLGADAALSAGMPQEAERLRKRLLLTNPHHMLRPYASMTEALESNDVRDYVADLRKQWPPATVEKMLNRKEEQPPAKAGAAKPAAAKKPAPKASATPEDEPVTGLAYTLSLVMLGAGLLIALGLFLAALVWPLFD